MNMKIHVIRPLLGSINPASATDRPAPKFLCFLDLIEWRRRETTFGGNNLGYCVSMGIIDVYGLVGLELVTAVF